MPSRWTAAALALFAASWPALAQSTEAGRGRLAPSREIETDRDSFTPAVSTVDRGRVIFETAYTFLDNRRFKETNSLPEALLRWGLTDRLELRLGGNYEVGGVGNEVSGSGGAASEDLDAPTGRLERATGISYGFKYRVTGQDELIPGSSLLVHGFTPVSGPENLSQAAIAYVFGWDFLDGWKLDAAFRYRTDAEKADHFNTWAPSVVLKAPVGERFNAHVEYFGLFSQGRAQDYVKHFISPGFHYLVTEDLEVGVRVGWGLNDQSARFFVNVGGGVRF
jgi:hypothetical protein